MIRIGPGCCTDHLWPEKRCRSVLRSSWEAEAVLSSLPFAPCSGGTVAGQAVLPAPGTAGGSWWHCCGVGVCSVAALAAAGAGAVPCLLPLPWFGAAGAVSS